MSKATRNQFLRVLTFLIVFVVFTVILYQRNHGNSLDQQETAISQLNNLITRMKENATNTGNGHAGHLESSIIVNAPSYRETVAKAAVKGVSSESEADMLREVQMLYDRVKLSLDWIANMKPKDSSSTSYPLIRWDLISNAEIHILHKLGKYLKKALSDPQAAHTLSNLVSKGYQCNAAQATQQEVIAKRISMDICSEVRVRILQCIVRVSCDPSLTVHVLFSYRLSGTRWYIWRGPRRGRLWTSAPTRAIWARCSCPSGAAAG